MSAPLQSLARDRRFELQLQLVREHWASVRRLWLGDSEPPGVGRFRADLPRDFWIGCGMPGLANISPAQDGCFEFDQSGQEALIIPAYSTVPGLLAANAERHIEHIVDLIAVDPEKPNNFRRKCSEALILGSAYLDIAAQECEPLPVFRSPLTWLRTGGNGIVVLDWNWARDLLLGHELIAEDVELGNRLDDALKPDIWVMENAA